MPSTDSDQENVLLASDAGIDPHAPGRLPIKALLVAVGLCLAAAGLAGAVVKGRQATHAPIEIKRPWDVSSLSSDRYEFVHKEYLSKECLDPLEALEKEAQEERRWTETANPHSVPDCKDSEQTCDMKLDVGGWPIYSMKCFPTTCKQEEIFKGMEKSLRKNAKAHGEMLVSRYNMEEAQVQHVSGLDANCVKGRKRELWKKYLKVECHEQLGALEKEAEESGRLDLYGNYSHCKDTEGTCTVDVYKLYQSPTENWVMCFPSICREWNIVKGMMKYNMDGQGLMIAGVVVNCTGVCTDPQGNCTS